MANNPAVIANRKNPLGAPHFNHKADNGGYPSKYLVFGYSGYFIANIVGNYGQNPPPPGYSLKMVSRRLGCKMPFKNEGLQKVNGLTTCNLEC